jgi:hypothetical protein
MKFRNTLLIGLALAAALSGCARTQQTRNVKATGFLGDYSQLQPGGAFEAQYRYVNPRAQFAAYDKVMIDPVMIWQDPNAKPSRVTLEDREQLAIALEGALRKELSAEYKIVGQPGPGTMRLRAALSGVRPSRPILDTVTTVLPYGLLTSFAKRLLTGTPSFVGKTAVEAEIVDSVSGERLMAAVDERAGRKLAVVGKFKKWEDAQSAFEYWAQRLRERLAEQRAQ